MIYDLFTRACRRELAPLTAGAGPVVSDPESGNRAQFDVVIGDNRIISAQFRATTCTTLVAACEYLSHSVAGETPAAVRALETTQLLEQFPEVPPARRGSIALALRALKSALEEPNA